MTKCLMHLVALGFPKEENMQPLRPWPYARVSAHRGAGTMAPENTLEGFRAGLHFGFHAFETDAMLAKDGVPVLMHDEHFGRTIHDTRSVPELTSQEIRCLDAGSWFAPQYTGVPPAGFEQAVRWCRANHVWLNIELKPAKGAELETGRTVGRLTQSLYADLIKPEGGTQVGIVPDVPLFSSFKPEALRGALEVAPDIPRGFLIDPIPENWREVLTEMKCVSLHCNHKRIDEAFVREVKSLGYWVFCYTVNDPHRALELFSWGVDGFCTNRLDLIHSSI